MVNKKQLSKGLDVGVIKKISQIKNEPKWMLDLRLSAFMSFKKQKNPTWGPNLKSIDFDDYIYYSSPVDKEATKWSDVPKKIKDTFKKLNVPELEAKILSGVNDQIDSQSVYHGVEEELKKQGVIFCTIEAAITTHPELVKKYFGKLVPFTDNKYAALNTSVWSGGSFIYIPKGVQIEKPLQAYFRIDTKSVGQFERTLIIIDDDATAHYVEGCTAPIYDKDNLHAAVVEVFIGKNSNFRYSTIQNWSNNVINLVTKRAQVGEKSNMEWIDGNLGSGINMKYPATILLGNNSSARCISVACSNEKIIQDTGAKMIHIGKNTRSQIISKSIASNGGTSNYRGLVKICKSASNSSSEVVCDSLLMDKNSRTDTIPTEIIENNTSFLKHEAKVTDIDKEKMFYLNLKGISEKQAKHLLVMGFIAQFVSELPLEYAVELNRLVKELI